MISFIDKLLFVEHLALMIRAGLPLREGVITIQEQTRSRKFRKILKDVVGRLNNGEPLGESLAFHPEAFNKLFTSMINIGEESGTLDKSLEYLAEQLKKSSQLKRKVIAAMIYPAIVLSATFGLGAGLAIFIFPKLIPLFKSLKIQLPLSARILLFVSEIIQKYGIFIVLGVAAFFTLFFLLSRLKFVKTINHAILLKIPVAGKVSQNFNLAVFSRTLGTLIKSGLSIVQALDITADTLGNLIYRKQAKKLSLMVTEGKQMSSYLKKKPGLFSLTFSRMVEVGEKTGNLENSLFYLADYYEKEVDNITQRLSTVLEPILLIIIGLVVGFVAISIVTPIYQITQGLEQ